jgi:hypothetical protein
VIVDNEQAYRNGSLPICPRESSNL